MSFLIFLERKGTETQSFLFYEHGNHETNGTFRFLRAFPCSNYSLRSIHYHFPSQIFGYSEISYYLCQRKNFTKHLFSISVKMDRKVDRKRLIKIRLCEEMVDKAFTCHETGRYYQIKTQKKEQ